MNVRLEYSKCWLHIKHWFSSYNRVFEFCIGVVKSCKVVFKIVVKIIGVVNSGWDVDFDWVVLVVDDWPTVVVVGLVWRLVVLDCVIEYVVVWILDVKDVVNWVTVVDGCIIVVDGCIDVVDCCTVAVDCCIVVVVEGCSNFVDAIIAVVESTTNKVVSISVELIGAVVV